MRQVIRISGKAKKVFKYIELAARHKGNVTIKDLAKNNKKWEIDLN
ncbi:hypothetical protein ACFLW6_01545 [Chloroflexota bacterium]